MNRILLVEDDLSLIDGLEHTLRKNDFQTDIAQTVQVALLLLASNTYDLLLLDLSLPDGTGFDICKKVRQTSSVPIIFLTASNKEVNVVKGLDIGGDDYIIKPFRLNELLSRINALLRRAGLTGKEPVELESNGISVRLLESRALKGQNELELTGAEYRLLCLLMKNPNTVLTREIILDKLWDNNGSFIDDNTLSVYVRRLRSKIEDEPENPTFLLTVRRLGYKWNIIK
jgi:two-component system response regulator RegX3